MEEHTTQTDLSRNDAVKPKKLLDQMRDKLRLRNYSYETEKTYIGWARRYIPFHDKRHPFDYAARNEPRSAPLSLPATTPSGAQSSRRRGGR